MVNQRQGRRSAARRGAILAATVLLCGGAALAQTPTTNPSSPPPAEPTDPMAGETMRADAWLHDACFAGPEQGWAVGDRGAIWHTDDAGRTWRLQQSGVACPLRSVCFVDEQTGWAAGGFAQPYADASRGVVLRTDDGGQTWRRDDGLLLPAVYKIRFLDRQCGWALGESSTLFPSGVFTTQDGGQSWSPMGGARRAGWSTGHLSGPRMGAVAGDLGATQVIREAALQDGRTPPLGLRTLHALQLVPPNWGWLAGDGGLVMLTGDSGTSWQLPPGEPPLGDPRDWDFAAVAVRGPKCWIAGSPGSRVFFTENAGQSWTAAPTGQNVPLAALAFADDRRGWAVGALGTILATEDGGRTWTRQRGGGARAALLGLFSSFEDVPLELVALLAGNEGYLGVIEILNRGDAEKQPAARSRAAPRMHEAMLRLGASGGESAWAFPLGEEGLKLGQPRILDAWDRANDGRGYLALQAHLVRQIRLWRPDVIVTHAPSPRGDRPRAHLVNQAVLEAAARAADPTSFPAQIAQAGLEPWQVKKVYAALPPGEKGSIEISAGQLADRLGRSVGELADGARELIAREPGAGPETVGFELLLNRLAAESPQDDFFAGIVLSPGGEARRQLIEPSDESLAATQRMAQRRRNVRMILHFAEQEPGQGPSLLAGAEELAGGMEPLDAGRVLHQLAEQYKRTGRWESAAQTLELLIERYPTHPLSGPAHVWLIQYYASAEAAWRAQSPQRHTEVRLDAPPVSRLSIDAARQQNRFQRAAALAKRLGETRPEALADPSVGFPLSVADRMRGFPREAARFLMLARRSPERDAWWRCAEGEAWLSDPKTEPPKPVLVCAVAPFKPRLDGRLDEEFWTRAQRAKLESARRDDEAWPATVRLAYDREFLYLAIECRRAPGAIYVKAKGPRPRDPDLSDHDRVDVYLDMDRDYVTCYRLSIDHRGWPGEDCWGDSTWNPAWFVAAGPPNPIKSPSESQPNSPETPPDLESPEPDWGSISPTSETPSAPPEATVPSTAQSNPPDDTWTAEAAIPLDQLNGRFPRSQDVWAVGMQRIVPGVGLQSWTTPAGTKPVPEGFGYLVFE
ncbi:MAG: hypothetical protein JW809_01025 [Pirellulales bacterium]|nr:hypothetical protein [Pirellulales bacterium]